MDLRELATEPLVDSYTRVSRPIQFASAPSKKKSKVELIRDFEDRTFDMHTVDMASRGNVNPTTSAFWPLEDLVDRARRAEEVLAAADSQPAGTHHV